MCGTTDVTDPFTWGWGVLGGLTLIASSCSATVSQCQSLFFLYLLSPVIVKVFWSSLPPQFYLQSDLAENFVISLNMSYLFCFWFPAFA